jgi:hypothetical protein
MRSTGALKVVIATSALVLIAPHFSPATAAPAAQLVTCVDLASGKERISKTGTCRTAEAMAKWRLAPVDSAFASGSTTKTLTVCSNKESSPFTYQLIRSKCAKHMQSGLYTRSSALPSKPVIVQVSANSYESASLSLASDPAANLDAPIFYYTITSSKGDVKKVNSWRDLNVTVFGLRSSTSYTFTITATNVDGTSPVSASSVSVTTQVYVAPVTASALAAPAFALSSIAETRTAKTSPVTGYTITSSGGAIASYQISPAAPAGLTFNTTSGLLSGTPTETKTVTTYTITGTNSAGSAAATFRLRVTGDIGDLGPGGGTIFYSASTPFVCGSTRASSCNYLEAAPSSWNVGADPNRSWANTTNQGTAVINATSPETATATAIGWGYRNTRAIILQGNADPSTSAAQLADEYTNTVNGQKISDWYLPSKDELNQMCKWQRGVAWTSDATVCTGGTINTGTGAAGFVTNDYWSSSESIANSAWFQYFGDGSQYNFIKSSTLYVRPVRAF